MPKKVTKKQASPRPSVDFDRLLDTYTTIAGTARNAKGGAVILVDATEIPVYVEGLSSWDGTHLDWQRVAVSGTLRQKKYIPDPAVDTDGAISQGAEGDQLVLEGAEWQPAD